jgi:hypothetical protein
MPGTQLLTLTHYDIVIVSVLALLQDPCWGRFCTLSKEVAILLYRLPLRNMRFKCASNARQNHLGTAGRFMHHRPVNATL